MTSSRACVLGPYRPQLLHGTKLFATLGFDVFVSEDYGQTFRRVCGTDVSRLHRWTSRSRLLTRIGRLGYHSLRILPDGSLIGIIRGHIVRRSREGGPFRPTLQIPVGSRPLCLCLHPKGAIYFGEYFSNARREPVRIFGSPDGRRWEPVHTFPAGTVRHIHGVVYDRFREGLWVLTGDEDSESGLWFTEDQFETIEPVVRGTQHARAVSLIPTRKGAIVPTDSPRIENRIQRLELPERSLTPLCPLPGSAFHAVDSAGLYLISTVAEPNSVGDERGATVYGSLNGEDWSRIDRFPPDTLCRLLPFARRVLRYPEVVLTPGRNETPAVFGFGRSVRRAEGRLLRWPRSEIKDLLQEAAKAGR